MGLRQHGADHEERPENPALKTADTNAFVVEKHGKDGLRTADVPEPAVGPPGGEAFHAGLSGDRC